MRHPLLLLLLIYCSCALAQGSNNETGLYFVGFRDKDATPFTTDEPRAYLSDRALLRRAKHGAPITTLDLPVDPAYQNGALATGAKLWATSRWMNGVVMEAAGPQITALRALPYVDTIYYVAPVQYDRPGPRPRIPNLDRPAPDFDPVPVDRRFYGFGWENLRRMRGDSLHRIGYRGRGVLVAVFDGGFPDVNYKEFLGYHRNEQVPASYDLVEQDSTALDGSAHGATVLSTMAAHHPLFLIGTAPDARYVLFKTENGRGEHRMEEINYAIALEIADSIGVDLVNSSLGYTTFTDEAMNYRYTDLDGRRSPASIAADHAFARGMVVVTSAGNNGGDKWKYIGIPADARGAFSIGALNDTDDERAYFSSFGPTADGRTKPDVSAPGVRIPAVSANGKGITGANGTSLSAPLVSGLLACLLQAVPDATNRELLEAVRQTASRASNPDNERGYGLPDFGAAYRWLMARRPPPDGDTN